MEINFDFENVYASYTRYRVIMIVGYVTGERAQLFRRLNNDVGNVLNVYLCDLLFFAL